jgi:hypothetical protein
MDMRKLALPFVLIIIAAVFVPAASALPRDSLYIGYYDCDLNLIGEYFHGCYPGSSYSWGSQTGAFKFEETDSCSGINESTYMWYASSGGGWTYLPYGPTACPQDETVTYYACWNEYAGTHYVDCNGSVTDSGTIGGTIKHVVKHRCSDNSVSVDQWYHTDSYGNWYPINPPNPYIVEC